MGAGVSHFSISSSSKFAGWSHIQASETILGLSAFDELMRQRRAYSTGFYRPKVGDKNGPVASRIFSNTIGASAAMLRSDRTSCRPPRQMRYASLLRYVCVAGSIEKPLGYGTGSECESRTKSLYEGSSPARILHLLSIKRRQKPTQVSVEQSSYRSEKVQTRKKI